MKMAVFPFLVFHLSGGCVDTGDGGFCHIGFAYGFASVSVSLGQESGFKGICV